MIFLIVGIIYAFSTAFFTGWLAGEKGYSSGLWGVLGFFFSFLALLTIGFAPIRNNSGKPNNNYSVENKKEWKCPKCNNINSNNTYQCERCGYNLV